MRILLVGEYSGLHNNLKKGLIALGHDVVIVGTSDGFKKYPIDFELTRKFTTGLSHKLKVAIYKLTGFDITALNLYKQFVQKQSQLKGFDIVQLINECPLNSTPKFEKKVISFLKQHNHNLFLLSCGTDHISVSYAYNGNFRYSILDPLYKRKLQKSDYYSILKYLNPEYQNHSKWLYNNIRGVIASDLDYHIPLLGNSKYLGLIPNPVNLAKLKKEEFKTTNPKPIQIFLGINKKAYLKKGIDYFEQALEIIKEKYGKAISVTTVENLPYHEYIKAFNNCHILLDQVLGYDQGYNALEAMAKGKVVFTGAEKEFYNHYNIKEKVAINALPDVDYLVKQFSILIENPELLQDISAAAEKFVAKYHDHINVAQKYIDTWGIHKT